MKEKLIKILLIDNLEKFLNRNWTSISFTTLLFLTFYQLPQRFFQNMDEINNTWKGANHIIFDYAGRPISLMLNDFAVQIFGNSPMGLSFFCSMLMIFSFYILETILQNKLFFDRFLLLSVYISFTTIHLHGTMGMVNSIHFFFSTIICTIFFSRRLQKCYITNGFLYALPIAVHTTHLVVSASLLLGTFLKTRSFRNTLLTFLGFIIFIMGLEVSYWLIFEDGYFNQLINGINKVGLPNNKYQHSFIFYFQIIVFDLIFCFVILTYLILSRIKTIKDDVKKDHALVAFLATTFLSVILISKLNWKFERVVMGVAPFVITSIWLTISKLSENGRWQRRIIFALLVCSIILSTTRLVNSRNATASENRANSLETRQNHLSALRTMRICLIRKSKGQHNHYVKKLLFLNDTNIYYKTLKEVELSGGKCEVLIVPNTKLYPEKLTKILETYSKYYQDSNYNIFVKKIIITRKIRWFPQN